MRRLRDILRRLIGGDPKPNPKPDPNKPEPVPLPPPLPDPGLDLGPNPTPPGGSLPTPVPEPDPVVKKVLELHNQTRDAYHMQPLRLDPRLNQAAQRHCDWMASVQKLSHTGASGSGVGERERDAGYFWQAAGENIAMGQPTPEEVVKAWFASTGHRTNMLGNYGDCGIGYAKDVRGRMWWCVAFGAAAQIPKMVGGTMMYVGRTDPVCPGGITADGA